MVRLTRRELLGLMGLGAAAVSASGIGGAAYLLLSSEVSAAPEGTPPTVLTARPPVIKRIDRPAIVPRIGWGAREPDHTAPNETGWMENLVRRSISLSSASSAK